MNWVPIVFGWPAALTSMVVSAVGLTLRRPAIVWLGALVGLPFMFYLFLTPLFGPLAAAAALCHFGAAVALRRSTVLAWLLFVPTPLVTLSAAVALAARAG
jgi:hypothetical protein